MKSNLGHNTGITNWYELKNQELLGLKNNLLNNLVLKGKEEAEGIPNLANQLDVSTSDFYNIINDRANLITVKKLKAIISYLKIDHHYLDDKISEIRKGRIPSITDPNFPFNLKNRTGARVLGNIVSDGCIYIDKKARGIKRTKYSAGTEEEKEKFIRNINKIFGEVHFQKSKQRNSTYLKIGTSIVGDALSKAGAPVGRKATINSGIPSLIDDGCNKIQKAYLQAIFDDEGCVGGRNSFPYVTLTRYFHINNELSKKQKSKLSNIKEEMNTRTFPTGHSTKSIRILKLEKLLNDSTLLNLLSDKAPELLKGESKLLKNFGIQNRIRNTRLSLTDGGRYSLGSEMRVYRKKSLLKFYNHINFGLTSKKKRLKQSLINCNWL